MSAAESISDKTVVASPSRRDSIETSQQLAKPADLEKALEQQEPSSEASEVHSESSQSSGDVSSRQIRGWRWALVCASIYIAAFTYGLDTTIAADIQGAVVETFGEVQEISWLGTGFLMGSVSTILLVGKLFELFDAKWNFIGGMVLFELGSVVCGAAPTMDALIVGRVIAGIGGSGIYLGGLTFFTGLTSESERARYVSGLGLWWGVGCVVGPIVGGAFADSSATWRWAFYINLVIAAVSAPGILYFLPSLRPVEGKSVWSRVAHIDWLGTVLSAATWVFFVTVLTFAGSIWPWSDGRTIAFWVLFGVFLAAFILQQTFSFLTIKEERIFPVPMLKSRSQIMLYIATSAISTALWVPIYYIPIYFQFVNGDTAILAAVRLLPYVIISMGVNLVSGFLLPKISHYAALYLVSGIFVIAGGAAMFTVGPLTKQANVYGYSVLIAIGAGAAIQSGYSLASVKAMKQGKPEDIGHTISFQNIAQIGSGAISLVIGGQVFQTYAFQQLSSALAGLGFTDEQIRNAVAGAQSTVFKEIDARTRELAVGAITDAISRVYILVIVAGAVAVISAIFMRWERLFS